MGHRIDNNGISQHIQIKRIRLEERQKIVSVWVNFLAPQFPRGRRYHFDFQIEAVALIQIAYFRILQIKFYPRFINTGCLKISHQSAF